MCYAYTTGFSLPKQQNDADSDTSPLVRPAMQSVDKPALHSQQNIAGEYCDPGVEQIFMHFCILPMHAFSNVNVPDCAWLWSLHVHVYCVLCGINDAFWFVNLTCYAEESRVEESSKKAPPQSPHTVSSQPLPPSRTVFSGSRCYLPLTAFIIGAMVLVVAVYLSQGLSNGPKHVTVYGI